MMMCQWGNRRGAKDGKGSMVRPVCTGKYRELSAQQSQRKSFCTKLRLERGEVCLPVKTFMVHDRLYLT